jgi:WD40 repeat protein
MGVVSGFNIGAVSGDFSLQAGGDIVAGNKTVINNIIQRLAKQLTTKPYKFLASYDIADRDIFYGRAATIEELAGEVARHQVTIINGASGSGKSSLVKAGVIPRLTENGYSYIAFREYSDPLAQFADIEKVLSVSPLPEDDIDSNKRAELAPQPAATLAMRVEGRKIAKAPELNEPSVLLQLIRTIHATPIVVVLDQFERFFVNVPTPNRATFISALRHCLHYSSAKEISFIIAVRQEFYGQLLSEFEAQMTDFSKEAYRLNLSSLGRSEARDAIVKPLENTSLKIQYDEDFVDEVLIDSLSTQVGRNSNINPPHLQIVCSQLFEAARRRLQQRNSVLIDNNLFNELGGAQTILETYLDKMVEEVASDSDHISVVRSVLQRMIDTTGTRRFVTEEILKRELVDISETDLVTDLRRLLERRVLDRRVVEGNAPTYSLSHEYLVQRVKEWFDPVEMERKRSQETLERGVAEQKNSQALLSRVQVEAVRKWATDLDPEEQNLLRDSEAAYLQKERQEKAQEEQLRASKVLSRRAIQIGLVTAGILTAVAIGFAGRYFKESKLALARQLAAQADYLRNKGTDSMDLSALLAIQSVYAASLIENDSALREVLSLLPKRTFIGDGPFLAVAWSPDGRYLATGGDDNIVRIFEATSGKESVRLALDGPVYAVAFSPDGRHVATASGDATARVFDATSGKETARLTLGGAVYAVTFSRDGRHIAVASGDGTARVFDATSGRETARLTHGAAAVAVVFSPDGRRVATASWDKTARVFEAGSGKETARLAQEGPVYAVAFSSDGRHVATGGEDSTARVFEAASGRETARLTLGGPVYAVAFSPDGRLVIAGSTDKTARIFGAASGRETARMTHGGAVVAVAFSPDGRYVATASEENAVRVFEASSGRESARLIQQGPVYAVAFSPDSRYIATASWDKTSRVFETSSGKEVAPLIGVGYVRAVAFSRDARYLVLSNDDNPARVFQASSGKEIARLTPYGRVYGVAFSPDGRYVAAASLDKTVQVFETGSGIEVARLNQPGPVHAVALSPDGSHIATGSEDGTARIFEIVSGKETARLTEERPVVAVAYSPDGNYVATGSFDNTARIFEAATGKEIARLTQEGPVVAVAFSPDGRFVATASHDKTARIFNASGTETARLILDDIVRAVAFSPDGRYVAAGSDDKTARIFETVSGREIARSILGGSVAAIGFSNDGRYFATASRRSALGTIIVGRELVRTNDLIEEACSRLTRNLTSEEWKHYLGDSRRQRTCLDLP